MTRWFRMYEELLDDPKVQLLSPELFKTWVNLLALACRGGGKLPAIRDMAFALRVSVEDMQSRIDDLVLAGLLDILPDKTIVPHNWSKRQWKSDDSGERVRRHRAKAAGRHPIETPHETPETPLRNDACNGDVTVTVTPPDTDTESDIIIAASCRGAARAKRKQPDFNLDAGRRRKPKPAILTQRAEGLGLNVAEIEAEVAAAAPDNPAAYFTRICVDRLRKQLPGVSETAVRDALWNKSSAPYTALMGALLLQPEATG